MQMYINKYCNMPWATGGSSGSGGGGSDPNVGLAVNNQFSLTADDQILKQLIESDGHTVHVFSDENIVPNPGIFEVIVVSKSISSSSSDNYVNIGTPILNLESSGYDDMNLDANSQTISGTSIEPLLIGHPILDGLPTTPFDIYNSSNGIATGVTLSASLSNVLTIVDKDLYPFLFIQLSGTLMYDGIETCTDNILCFGTGENTSALTPNGKKLFLNSLNWLINN